MFSLSKKTKSRLNFFPKRVYVDLLNWLIWAIWIGPMSRQSSRIRISARKNKFGWLSTDAYETLGAHRLILVLNSSELRIYRPNLDGGKWCWNFIFISHGHTRENREKMLAKNSKSGFIDSDKGMHADFWVIFCIEFEICLVVVTIVVFSVSFSNEFDGQTSIRSQESLCQILESLLVD